MAGFCACCMYLLLACAVVISNSASITNRELYEILKENSEDMADNYNDVTMDSDDDTLSFPGNADDQVDIEYLLNKVFNGILYSDFNEEGHANIARHHSCECHRRSCKCCIDRTFHARFQGRDFRKRLNGCLKVEYLGRGQGFGVTITVNGRTYFRKQVSLRHLSALCFEVPGLRMFAELCVGLYDIDLRRRSACARLTGKLRLEFKTFRIHTNLGCFRIPILDYEILQNVGNDAVASFQNTHDLDVGLDEQDVKESFEEDLDLDLNQQEAVAAS